MSTPHTVSRSEPDPWLQTYYYVRAAFSVCWVVAAFTLGQNPTIAAALLLIYPAWDAVANYLDASRSGGLARNPTQAVNLAVSLLAAIAVLVTQQMSGALVLSVFGIWALLSGLLQLGTAIRRWKTSGAQWVMILSGAQSGLAGGFFFAQSVMPAAPQAISIIPGYAALGAIYFLISAVWLTVEGYRAKAKS
jgi:hypothetical protein